MRKFVFFVVSFILVSCSLHENIVDEEISVRPYLGYNRFALFPNYLGNKSFASYRMPIHNFGKEGLIIT
ncbi:MAG: hypothetical protein ACRCV0_04575, partial [Brevinema sp.]